MNMQIEPEIVSNFMLCATTLVMTFGYYFYRMRMHRMVRVTNERRLNQFSHIVQKNESLVRDVGSGMMDLFNKVEGHCYSYYRFRAISQMANTFLGKLVNPFVSLWKKAMSRSPMSGLCTNANCCCDPCRCDPCTCGPMCYNDVCPPSCGMNTVCPVRCGMNTVPSNRVDSGYSMCPGHCSYCLRNSPPGPLGDTFNFACSGGCTNTMVDGALCGRICTYCDANRIKPYSCNNDSNWRNFGSYSPVISPERTPPLTRRRSAPYKQVDFQLPKIELDDTNNRRALLDTVKTCLPLVTELIKAYATPAPKPVAPPNDIFDSVFKMFAPQTAPTVTSNKSYVDGVSSEDEGIRVYATPCPMDKCCENVTTTKNDPFENLAAISGSDVLQNMFDLSNADKYDEPNAINRIDFSNMTTSKALNELTRLGKELGLGNMLFNPNGTNIIDTNLFKAPNQKLADLMRLSCYIMMGPKKFAESYQKTTPQPDNTVEVCDMTNVSDTESKATNSESDKDSESSSELSNDDLIIDNNSREE